MFNTLQMEVSGICQWMVDLHWSHESHVKPEGQAMHQAWVHHVELKGDLYPGTPQKKEVMLVRLGMAHTFI